MSLTASAPYRRDIDGLRAIAVLSVVLYHLDVPGFGGGFVGVDIFFVISGYLITGIILRELVAGTFSLAGFYERRVRRIFPALASTIAATLAIATVIYDPHELLPVLDATRYLAVFISNIYFASQGGYFDAPLAANPLLQTWSLSVEEQFYLAAPLAIAALFRHARRWIVPALAAVALVSLGFGVWRLGTNPIKAFFLIEVRAVELLIGALLAAGAMPLLSTRSQRETVALVGALAVVGSIVLVDPDGLFPGPGALPVCLGTAMIIWAGETEEVTLVKRLLSVGPMVAIGLVSYSLYLVHWPLIVFTKRLLVSELTAFHTAALLVAALVLSAASWRFVELPLRSRQVFGRRLPLFVAAATLSAVFAITAITVPRVTGLAHAKTAAIGPGGDTRPKYPCLVEKTEGLAGFDANCIPPGHRPKIAAWGDSYAAHYFEGLRLLPAAGPGAPALLGFGGCPPATGLVIRERPTCRGFNDAVLAKLLELKPRVVVLSANWLNYEKRRGVFGVDVVEALRASIATLAEAGIQVLVVGPSPVFSSAVPLIARATTGSAAGGAYAARYSRVFDGVFRDLAAAGRIAYVAPYKLFCDDAAVCRYRGDRGLYFHDNGHMTRAGADIVLADVARALDRLLQN